MLATKAAIERATQEITTIFPEIAERNLRLKEVETLPSGGRWRLTFGASNGEPPTGNGLTDLFRISRDRKIVELDADDGSLVSIKAA